VLDEGYAGGGRLDELIGEGSEKVGYRGDMYRGPVTPGWFGWLVEVWDKFDVFLVPG